MNILKLSLCSFCKTQKHPKMIPIQTFALFGKGMELSKRNEMRGTMLRETSFVLMRESVSRS